MPSKNSSVGCDVTQTNLPALQFKG